MNLTLKLLKTIGSPFAEPEAEIFGERELVEFYNYAEMNKISLLFLDSYRRKGNLGGLESAYKKSYARYLKIDELMGEVSHLLTESGIEHVIFKTIRPYIAETSDVDILILKDRDYAKAVRDLNSLYGVLGYGPESITFYSPKADIGIDLYRNIAVSHVEYLNKEELFRFTIEKQLSYKNHVMTLSPEADLLAIIAHSMIKEQLFTLAEYYTFLYHLSALDRGRVNDLVSLINNTNTSMSAEPFITLTSILHKACHGKTPSVLRELLANFPETRLEAKRFNESDLKVPHSYSVLTLAKALSEKMKNERTKRSLAIQLWNMLKPSFSMSVIDRVLEHRIRETY
jgi:hypothetical protein